MMKVAIVEDEDRSAEDIERLILKYREERKVVIEYERFVNALNFLDDGIADFDVILLDIQMPHMDGMELAKKLRAQSDCTIIIFVTNMAQYAINGYEVDAMGFMLKPVNYTNFQVVFDKALNRLGLKGKSVTLETDGGYIKVDISSITYVESEKHYLNWHIADGRILRTRQPLGDIEKDFSEYGFSRSDRSYLVNFAYVTKVDGNDVWIGKDCLPISRGRKAEFMGKFAVWMGGGK